MLRMSFFSRVAGKIARSIPQNETDLFLERARFQFSLLHRRVGGPDKDLAVPRNDEEDPAVIGMGHHDRRIALKKFAVKNEMHALAWLNRTRGTGLVHKPDLVGEDAGGVDDNPRLELVALAAVFIPAFNTVHHVARFCDCSDGYIVQNASTMIHG